MPGDEQRVLHVDTIEQRVVKRRGRLLASIAVLVCAGGSLIWMQAGTLRSREDHEVDAAVALVNSRRVQATVIDNIQPQMAPADPARDANRAAVISVMAASPDRAEREPLGRAAPAAVSATSAGCAAERRPYHTLLTSSSGTYQSFQCRIMYHHFKLQQRADPCGEMGGFTRVMTSFNGQGDAFMDEIPTVVMKEASSMGYVVVNRPHSMVQFVSSPAFRERVVEEYVYIAETDHVLLRPLPNLATPTVPAGFNFGYMVAWGQAKIVEKFVPGLGGSESGREPNWKHPPREARGPTQPPRNRHATAAPGRHVRPPRETAM